MERSLPRQRTSQVTAILSDRLSTSIQEHRNRRGGFFRLLRINLDPSLFIRACYTVDLAPVMKCNYRINNPVSSPSLYLQNRHFCSVISLSPVEVGEDHDP